MATIQVSTEDYEILASILKEGPGMRRPFTFKELLNTLKNIGFSESKGRLVYDGKALFAFKGEKGRDVVSYVQQDDLKRQLRETFGWTKGSFEEEPGL